MWNKYLDRITELEWIVKERDKQIENMKSNIKDISWNLYEVWLWVDKAIEDLDYISYK